MFAKRCYCRLGALHIASDCFRPSKLQNFLRTGKYKPAIHWNSGRRETKIGSSAWAPISEDNRRDLASQHVHLCLRSYIIFQAFSAHPHHTTHHYYLLKEVYLALPTLPSDIIRSLSHLIDNKDALTAPTALSILSPCQRESFHIATTNFTTITTIAITIIITIINHHHPLFASIAVVVGNLSEAKLLRAPRPLSGPFSPPSKKWKTKTHRLIRGLCPLGSLGQSLSVLQKTPAFHLSFSRLSDQTPTHDPPDIDTKNPQPNNPQSATRKLPASPPHGSASIPATHAWFARATRLFRPSRLFQRQLASGKEAKNEEVFPSTNFSSTAITILLNRVAPLYRLCSPWLPTTPLQLAGIAAVIIGFVTQPPSDRRPIRNAAKPHQELGRSTASEG